MCLLSGHFDGGLCAWDSSSLTRFIWRAAAHESAVNTVYIHPNAALAVTGGRDGKVMLWDMRQRQSVGMHALCFYLFYFILFVLFASIIYYILLIILVCLFALINYTCLFICFN